MWLQLRYLEAAATVAGVGGESDRALLPRLSTAMPDESLQNRKIFLYAYWLKLVRLS